MKRKLNYKKILIATGILVVVAAATTIAVVATKSTKSEAKKELSSIITKLEVDGNKFNTEETVLNEIIRLNEEITSEHVEIKNFITASEIKNGSAELHAKADSKYTGQVNITITAKDKIALDSKITNKEVDGNKFNTEKAVLDEIIKQNKDVTANDVEIKNFKAASEATAGSAELNAKTDSKYTGKVNIIITKVDTEEERLEKIIKKIKVANDKERYGKEYVEAYKEYFAFLEKTMEAKFKIDPWVTDQEPTDSNKSSTFYKLENYMREIRISHYRLGLVEQRILVINITTYNITKKQKNNSKSLLKYYI
ncbi:hypothetical protein [Spiroplasma endosymbiont of Andrena trimmerana]|uniref:hypothetical protein n=1 Tax=Spiroplasma endosymbiont of Andrena trimmerana TaxID=3066316 RepID=UPI0030CEF2B3